MPTTSDLHILQTDVKLADFPEIFAESAVKQSVTGGIVSAVGTCRTIYY